MEEVEKKKKQLSIDDKLDGIMEAVVFLQQLNIHSLKAMDQILGVKLQPQSQLIKPNNQLMV